MKPPIALAIATFYVSWVTSRASALDGKAENAAKLLAASIQISTATGPIPGRPTDVESARAAVLAGNYTKNVHFQERDRCPLACSSTAANTSGWYVYGGLQRLHRACEKPMLLDLALSNPIGTDTPHVAVSACTADFESPVGDEGPSDPISATSCGLEGVETSKATSYVQLKKSGPSNSAHVVDVASIVDQLQRFSELTVSGCNETIKFAYFGSVAVGVYSGSGFANRGVLGPVLGALSRQVRSDDNVAEETSAQLCSNSSSRYSLGVMINTKGNLGAVQHALYTWKNSSCIDGGTTVSDWKSVTYHVPSLLLSQYNSSATNNTRGTQRRGVLRQLTIRAEACTTIQVHSGDSCGSLAAQCGISASDFTKYNPSSSLCSGLVEGQHVCCSAGSLPDFTPKPDANGYCHTYFVYAGDSCSSIAAANSITNEKIEEFNRNTWGWNGCAKMFADYNICLSSGFPPMPASIPNAQCGPQVNDTATPPPGTDLSTLNQCPLNACCNIWGQCGTTTEFCTVSKSKTGAPGTAAPGENGCISNCGTTIIASEAPAEPFSIAYFEAFNWQRPCLRMPITKVDTKAYTHIHFSFITLNEDFTINTNGVADQLMLFRGMGDIKKVVSLGGWSFSTEPATYAILRNAVATEANRQALVTNVVNFLNDNRLDGIDWDWEYPDEPDIPGIPAGSEDESTGFFLLLDELKQKMPAGKTVSVTAPASYWYLQHFPIQAISLVVDYLVYMTYDLHGQWDYSNKYASSGCTSYDKGLGNCLRSHVNLTETINSLSMITKAGVPSKMIAVGVSSYGRSFKMETAGCWTEQCTYTGPESGAYKGRCTGTAGYISDFEIGEILAQNPSAQSLYDADSMSNIVVFNQTEWVAYMDKDNKAQRKALFPGINFLGSADWAVDLQSEDGGGDGNGSGGNGGSDQTFYIDPAIWGSLTPRVTVPPGVTLIWPPMPLPTPTTITFPSWTTAVSYSSLTTRTSTGSDGSTSTFPFYVYTTWQTVLTIPPVTTTAIPVWGITLDETSTEGVILLTSSIQPPPFTITVTPVMNGSISVIGASETTTSTPIPIFWGTKTYTPPVVTRTEGRSTTVVGGVTLPAGIITVTPNPHPMTTPTPRITDPVLNSRQPSWTSGTGTKIQPTAKPGCKGCGSPCKLFCDSLCPFCPPGIFGNPHGGGSSGNNPNDPDEDPEDPEHPQYTVLVNGMDGDAFPQYLAAADMDALGAEMRKWFSSVLSSFASTKTITKTKPPTTSTTTVVVPGPAPPIPEAKCEYWYEFSNYHFRISGIHNWAENDRGHGLHDNENGCGAVTAWTWTSLTEDRKPIADFFLPLFIKQGCVERAIASAGGPKISCQYDGVSLSSVEDGVGQGTPPNPPYVPMDWSKEAEGAGATPVVTITSWSVPKQSWVPYI